MINIKDYQNYRSQIESDFLPDLTPLIDVMFMLIIFLILTMNISFKAFDIDVSQDKDVLVNNSAQKALDLAITKDNKWLLDGKKFDNFADLKKDLLKLKKDINLKKINIICDKSVESEKLIRLLILIKSQNIKSSDIIVR